MLRICFNLGYQPKEWEVLRILVEKSLQYGEAAFLLSSLYFWFLKSFWDCLVPTSHFKMFAGNQDEKKKL